MVVIVWLLAIVGLGMWWVCHFDLPDRNPFAVIRAYRLILVLLLLSVVVVGFKAREYRQELRFQIRLCQ